MTKIYKGKFGTVEYSPEYKTLYLYSNDKEQTQYAQISMTNDEFKEMISGFFNIDEVNNMDLKTVRNHENEMARYENILSKNNLVHCNEILGIVQNLNDTEEAKEYARLYIKAQKEAVKTAGEEYDFDENEVMRLVKETDSRI